MENLIAQSEHPVGGPITGIGPLGLENLIPDASALVFATVLSNVIAIMTIVAGIWFVFVLITGGYQFLSSEGDKAAVTAARKKMTMGLLGLVIVVIAIFLFEVVTRLLGLTNILDIQFWVTALGPPF